MIFLTFTITQKKGGGEISNFSVSDGKKNFTSTPSKEAKIFKVLKNLTSEMPI